MLKRPAIEFTTSPAQVINIPGWSLILLFLAYILPGNLGHAPWRGDDVLHIATTASMLRTGDWLVPRIAGIAFLDSPPLHYWLGGICGNLLGWLLPLHDAIRLASVAALAFGLWALRAAAMRLVPDNGMIRYSGNATLLLALSSMGLLIHAHEAQPLITLFATIGSTLWGLSMLATASRKGVLIAGGSVGAAFLAGGLPGLLLTVPACVAALTLSKQDDSGPSRRDVLTGMLLAIAMIAIWPLLLTLHDPALLRRWWQQELLGITPSFGSTRLSALGNLLSWFTWPLWPIAGWTLWNRRHEIAKAPYAVPLTALIAALWVVLTTGSVRPANALPILPSLILLAGPEVSRLRKGASNLLDWFGIMMFSLLGAFLWLAWCALHAGWPTALARNVLRLAPDFATHVSWWAIPLAIMLSLGWIIAMVGLPRFPLRGVLRWALGVTLAWGLATTLWLDWFDYDKNYSRITTQIAAQVKLSKTPCLMEIGAGDVQRAALDYFNNIHLQRFSKSNTQCDLVFSYRAGRNALPEPGEGWALQWNMSKGRGRLQEQFALFRRN